MLRGRAGLSEFSNAAAADPAVKAFRRRGGVISDDRLDKMGSIMMYGSTTVRVPGPMPMYDAKLEAEFRVLAGAQPDDWLRFVDSLEPLDKVSLPD